MSYAVIHMQKFKTGGIRGINNHNERLKESKTNPDIDPTKTHLNKDLHGEDDRTYYMRVKDRIAELDLPKAVRKDAVTMCGFVATSDKEFFDKLPQSEQDRFFKESHDFLKNRYGEKNIVASKVHYDETTPHLHCYIVPVTEDGRLSAKNVFTRSELRKLQTEYHKHMNDKGFELERGLNSDGKRKHLDTQEFKLETRKKEIEKSEIELDKVSDKLQGKLEAHRDAFSSLNYLEHVEAKPSFTGSKMTISKRDYNEIMSMAKKGLHDSSKVNMLEREINNQKHDLNEYKRVVNQKNNKINDLTKKNTKLNDDYKDLKEQGKAMFDTLKKHNLVPEAQEVLKNMREAEKVAEKVLNKAPSRGWDMER